MKPTEICPSYCLFLVFRKVILLPCFLPVACPPRGRALSCGGRPDGRLTEMHFTVPRVRRIGRILFPGLVVALLTLVVPSAPAWATPDGRDAVANLRNDALGAKARTLVEVSDVGDGSRQLSIKVQLEGLPGESVEIVLPDHGVTYGVGLDDRGRADLTLNDGSRFVEIPPIRVGDAVEVRHSGSMLLYGAFESPDGSEHNDAARAAGGPVPGERSDDVRETAPRSSSRSHQGVGDSGSSSRVTLPIILTAAALALFAAGGGALVFWLLRPGGRSSQGLSTGPQDERR
jgi:hypothetical protein